LGKEGFVKVLIDRLRKYKDIQGFPRDSGMLPDRLLKTFSRGVYPVTELNGIE
jgi:hypothetical protein